MIPNLENFEGSWNQYCPRRRAQAPLWPTPRRRCLNTTRRMEPIRAEEYGGTAISWQEDVANSWNWNFVKRNCMHSLIFSKNDLISWGPSNSKVERFQTNRSNIFENGSHTREPCHTCWHPKQFESIQCYHEIVRTASQKNTKNAWILYSFSRHHIMRLTCPPVAKTSKRNIRIHIIHKSGIRSIRCSPKFKHANCQHTGKQKNSERDRERERGRERERERGREGGRDVEGTGRNPKNFKSGGASGPSLSPVILERQEII